MDGNITQASQLCQPLSAILTADSEAGPISILDYFVQYMERENALHLLQFWFAVQSFKNAASAYHRPNHVIATQNSNKSAIGHVTSTGDSSKASLRKHYNDVSMVTGKNNVCSHVTVVDRSQVSTCIEDETRFSDVCEDANVTGIISQPLPSQLTTSNCQHQAIDGCESPHHERSCSAAVGGKGISQRVASTSKDGQTSRVVREDTPDGMHVNQRLLKQLSLNVTVDALSIYTTYIALNALSPVTIPDALRQQIEVNICPEDGKVSRDCFDKAQTFVYRTLEQRYYPLFLSSHELCKYQYEYITSGKLCLLDFLLGDNALFYFMEYMEQESSTSLAQFWLTAESFKTQLSDPLYVPSIDRDTEDAMAIYNRYFSLQATTQLHLGDTIRMDIENKICDENGPRADSYGAAQKHVYDIMNEFHFPGFLKSSVYLRFLNELVMMLNKPAASTTSALSSDDHNTQSNSSHAKIVDQLDFAENLDDPDSLWWRPPSLMRLGYVDEYGQYISEIESIPTKSVRHKGDASKKFSWLGKSRDEEEIAMKIARTIVKEILDSVYRNSNEKTPST